MNIVSMYHKQFYRFAFCWLETCLKPYGPSIYGKKMVSELCNDASSPSTPDTIHVLHIICSSINIQFLPETEYVYHIGVDLYRVCLELLYSDQGRHLEKS